VKEVLVRVSDGDVVDNRDMPDINLQHMMAVMLVDGTASFASAHDKARMKDAAIVRHRAKVRLIPNDPQIVGRQAIVEVTLVDGTRLTEFVKAVRGTAENPMTRDEVVEKCRDLITPILGGPGWSRLSERVLNLERAGSVAELSGLLRRA
jgi:2-methylcitrate dehydratase PrpD